MDRKGATRSEARKKVRILNMSKPGGQNVRHEQVLTIGKPVPHGSRDYYNHLMCEIQSTIEKLSEQKTEYWASQRRVKEVTQKLQKSQKYSKKEGHKIYEIQSQIRDIKEEYSSIMAERQERDTQDILKGDLFN